MDTILGIVMIASWIWSIVILARKTKDTTTLEKWVLGVGVVGITLFVIGSLV